MTISPRRSVPVLVAVSLVLCLAVAAPVAVASPFFFSTGDTDGRIATASRPDSSGKIEIESADDFIISTTTALTSATFTGLLTSGATLSDINAVRVEIYRVFPMDSTFPPSGNVPTRVNSPSDTVLEIRDSGLASLSFLASVLSSSFTANNSVINGIFPIPG